MVIDDEVISAPVVQTEIRSNKLTLSTGIGDLPTKLERAHRWKDGLLVR